jgi:hypothetical protein
MPITQQINARIYIIMQRSYGTRINFGEKIKKPSSQYKKYGAIGQPKRPVILIDNLNFHPQQSKHRVYFTRIINYCKKAFYYTIIRGIIQD